MAEAKTIARGSITIIDYNDAASISTLLESNKPITIITTDAARSSKWTESSPLILSPVVYVSSTDNSANVNQAKNITDMTWYYQSGGSEWTKVTSADNRFEMVTVGENKNQIKIKCDDYTNRQSLLTENNPVITFKYSGTFVDPVSANRTPVTANITFSLVRSGSDKTASVVYTPNGNVFTNGILGDDQEKTAVLELWRGATPDFTKVEFRWYLQNSLVFAPMKIKTNVASNATEVFLTDDTWSEDIDPGSILLFSDNSVTFDPKSPKLRPGEYVVKSVDNNAKKIVLTTPVAGGAPANSYIVSKWYDHRAGAGWAWIKATSHAEAVQEKLATNGTKGIYVNKAWNLSSLPSGGATDPEGQRKGGNELVVPAAAVVGMITVKGIVFDIDAVTIGADREYVARPQIINFLDYTDPYQVNIVSNSGNIIRNGQGFLLLEAEVRQGGQLIDNPGALTYKWKLYNKNGAQVSTFHHGSNTPGKLGEVQGLGRDSYTVRNPLPGVGGSTNYKYYQLAVSKPDITGQGTITCEVSVE